MLSPCKTLLPYVRSAFSGPCLDNCILHAYENNLSVGHISGIDELLQNNLKDKCLLMLCNQYIKKLHSKATEKNTKPLFT